MSILYPRAELLRALADPTRLRLLLALRDGELTVSEMTEVTGLSQPRVSRHLRLLSDAGLLARTRDQNEIYYRATIDSGRRPLLRATLTSLSGDDPVLNQDRERLAAILERRRERAAALLEAMGIRPLGRTVMAEVGSAVDDLLGRHLNGRAPKDLLDVGTGTGGMLSLMAPRVRRAVGVDTSREMRLVARAAVLSKGLANCTVCEGDMYALGFDSAHFDIVTIDRVLGAAERPELAVAEAARVLRPGGHLLIVEATASPLDQARLAALASGASLAPLESRHAGQRAAVVTLARRPARSGIQAA